MTDGALVLVAGSLLAAGLAAGLLAGRLRVPSLLLFLGLGMAVGSDGTGWVEFDDYALARRIGVVALALILFEGGLVTGYREIRTVLAPSLSLALLGTLLTAVIAGLAAAWLFDLSTLEGLLLGSIVASTDGAATFALLRGSTLRRRMALTLEGEAGFNDPVAVLLVLGFIDWIQKPDYGLLDMLALFLREFAIGAVVGVAVGVLAVAALRRLKLASGGLYPVASISAAALAYGAGATLHGSGFLAVYLAGLVLGGSPIPARRTITAFHEGLAQVAQIVLFLTLGLLVFPSQLDDFAFEGTVLALLIVFVARPLATFAATPGLGFSVPERVVLGWAGLRGAVPVVLATFPVIAGVPHSVQFFDIVFFAVVVSTLLQGATFEPLAKRMGTTTTQPALPRPLAESGTVRALGAEVVEVPIGAGDAAVGVRIRDLGLPRDALVSMIVRDEHALPPRGSMQVHAGDVLHVLIREEVAREIEPLIERWRDGPLERDAPPSRQPRSHASIFSVRPWRAEHGDPARPEEIGGHRVVARLRTRRDVPGALVRLDNGDHAITGPVLAVGGRAALDAYARRRAHGCPPAERSWWEDVLGELAR